VPHLQLVNALVNRLDPSLLVWGWFARTARTNSPPHSEHSRFCIALVKEWVAQSAASCDLASYYGTDTQKQLVKIDRPGFPAAPASMKRWKVGSQELSRSGTSGQNWTVPSRMLRQTLREKGAPFSSVRSAPSRDLPGRRRCAGVWALSSRSRRWVGFTFRMK
jgi:hypothetical protein